MVLGVATTEKTHASFVGREDEGRELLALLRSHPVVVLLAGRGYGKTTLLKWVARRLDVPLYSGQVGSGPVDHSFLIVDDADTLSPRARGALVRSCRKKGVGLLLAVVSPSRVPSGAEVMKLAGLGREAAIAHLCSGLGVSEETFEISDLVDLLGDHPGLLGAAIEAAGGRAPTAGTSAKLLGDLACLLRQRWVDPLSTPMRRAAAVLVHSGGRLPRTLGVSAFEAAMGLVHTGLADLEEGDVCASPLLSAAEHPLPGRSVLRSVLGALRGKGGRRQPCVLLAQAHLLHRLGDDDGALVALRGAYRLRRGTAHEGDYERAVRRLFSDRPSALGDAARLAWLMRRAGKVEGYQETLRAVEDLLARGASRSEETLDARAFKGFLHARVGEFGLASSELTSVARDASLVEDRYAEAHAVLWQAWLFCKNDEEKLAGEAAARAVRLARRAEAPVLRARALHFLGRSEFSKGDCDAAWRRLEQSLRLCRRHGLEDDHIVVLDALAELAGRLGRPSEAADHLRAAEELISRSGDGSRASDIGLTRAEVALRRGHITEAREILDVLEEVAPDSRWRRDLLEAEVALAADDLSSAVSKMAVMAEPSSKTRSWRRRLAWLASGIIEEHLDSGVDLSDCLEDPLASLLLRRAEGDREGALEAVPEVAEKMGADETEDRLLLQFESARLLILSGRIEEAVTALRELQGALVHGSPPTAVMLFLEALEQLARGNSMAAATCAAKAHRSAARLGHGRLANYALECLVFSRLVAGRSRGLRFLFDRGERLARKSASPTRCARFAAYRVAAAVRFGRSPDCRDVLEAKAAGDPLVTQVTEMLLSGTDSQDGSPSPTPNAAIWFRSLALTGKSRIGPVAPTAEERATELRLDGSRGEAVLAGGKRIGFGRRRVLWRLLWKLVEAGGEPTSPEDLYRTAWQLPFNQNRLNSLYVGVRRLRLLVEPDPSSPRLILAAAGGYCLDVRRVEAAGPSPFEDD